jgi:three-Cys-motif partner protein
MRGIPGNAGNEVAMTYPVSAVDGRLLRPSGPWAQEKLLYLANYMAIFNTSMKDKWRRIYLDLMAGPGRCVEVDTGFEFDGSPLLAAACKVPFSEMVFVESHRELAAALRDRVGTAGTVIEADCNDTMIVDQLRARLAPATLGLAFVDNLGLDVPLATLERLSSERRLDLFITFQIGDLKRNLRHALAGKDSARWAAFFGSGWEDVARDAERRNLSASDTTTRLLDFYGRQLQSIGYAAVTHSQQVMKNSRQVGLYRLVLAGKHPLAATLFDKISAIEPSGQRRML